MWNGGPIGIPFVTVPGTQTKYPATFLYCCPVAGRYKARSESLTPERRSEIAKNAVAAREAKRKKKKKPF